MNLALHDFAVPIQDSVNNFFLLVASGPVSPPHIFASDYDRPRDAHTCDLSEVSEYSGLKNE